MFALTRVAVCALCVVCNVSVCALYGCAVCGCGVQCVGVVVVCRTHSQDHGVHKQKDVHVGATFFDHFLKKHAVRNTYFP